MRQEYEPTIASTARYAAWVEFFAALFGAGAMLLVLHLLGVLTLLQHWIGPV